MKLHKKFIDTLSKHELAYTCDLFKIVIANIKIDNYSIMNIAAVKDELAQIYFTIDYLLINNLVTSRPNSSIFKKLDFAPTGMYNYVDKTKYIYTKTNINLKKYSCMKLLINSDYKNMIDNGYKTDEEKDRYNDKVYALCMVIAAAVLSSSLTAILTTFLPIIFRN